jgi:hypothetical protein
MLRQDVGRQKSCQPERFPTYIYSRHTPKPKRVHANLGLLGICLLGTFTPGLPLLAATSFVLD